ncbi:flagellar motor switch protein FliN [Leptospira santarosai str. MOR084]|uniref:Flagellar motor switch protein FliN n=3 Tax=Leptospira santarosai TaxID=28183 RepID=A0A0E2BKV0_9LEPT|nr:flagellar motor switch protein FliN [Leptospira santarosai str. MOR084]
MEKPRALNSPWRKLFVFVKSISEGIECSDGEGKLKAYGTSFESENNSCRNLRFCRFLYYRICEGEGKMGEGSLSQEDIDALLTGGGGGEAAPPAGESDFNLSGELDSLLGGGAGSGGTPGESGGGTDSPSFADISAALGPSPTPAPSAPRPASRQSASIQSTNLNLLMDVNLALTVELGRTNMFIKDVNGLNEGVVVELDKNVGEDLDILANGRLVGRGKLVAMDDFYGIQITEIVDQSRRL